MRKPKIDQIPDLNPNPESKLITQTRHYKLITPLCGGGPESKVNDPHTPVRGSAIRGQLRFWWRAMRGGQSNGDLEVMYKCENKIWGGAAKKGEKQLDTVQMAIEMVANGIPVEAFKHVQKGRNLRSRPNPVSHIPTYAAFSIQRSDEELRENKPPRTLLRDVEFKLHLRFHESVRSEVEDTLWAWEIFGGVGSRTRRGFGAVHCELIVEDDRKTFKPYHKNKPLELKKEIRDRLRLRATGKWPNHVPHLLPNYDKFLTIVQADRDVYGTWEYLIKKLHTFRQSRVDDDHQHSNWPEANEIRKMRGVTQLGDSPQLPKKVEEPVFKFPRAQLGLPILFHFPQDQTLNGTLKGAEVEGKQTIERMASRLILRPLLTDSQGNAVGLAIALKAPILPPDGIALDGTPVSGRLTKSEAALIEPIDGKTSVMQAFFDYLRK